MAGEPVKTAQVWVGPPLSARASSIAFVTPNWSPAPTALNAPGEASPSRLEPPDVVVASPFAMSPPTLPLNREAVTVSVPQLTMPSPLPARAESPANVQLVTVAVPWV